MNSKNQNKNGEIRSLYLIGDDGCSKESIFQLLQLEQQELNHQINVYVKTFSTPTQNLQPSIQLYDFPTDRVIRPAMSLYLHLLPPPSYIFYFMKDGASEKDICEWIKVLSQCQVTSRVIFLSDVGTYSEREKILTRLAKEFAAVMDSTFFLKLEPYAFRTAFDRFSFRGINIDTANCLKPTFSLKIILFFSKTLKSLYRRRAKDTSHDDGPSIV